VTHENAKLFLKRLSGRSSTKVPIVTTSGNEKRPWIWEKEEVRVGQRQALFVRFSFFRKKRRILLRVVVHKSNPTYSRGCQEDPKFKASPANIANSKPA
jgi:hypothetical protein